MLYLETYGYGYSIRRAQSIVNWFISEYLPRHKITVDINHRGMRRDCALAWIGPVDSQYRPRHFEIEMQSNLDADTYTVTLLHELIHLRQWVEGSLKTKNGKMYYKDTDLQNLDYSEHPHEIEAQSLEKVYYLNYLKSIL